MSAFTLSSSRVCGRIGRTRIQGFLIPRRQFFLSAEDRELLPERVHKAWKRSRGYFWAIGAFVFVGCVWERRFSLAEWLGFTDSYPWLLHPFDSKKLIEKPEEALQEILQGDQSFRGWFAPDQLETLAIVYTMAKNPEFVKNVSKNPAFMKSLLSMVPERPGVGWKAIQALLKDDKNFEHFLANGGLQKFGTTFLVCCDLFERQSLFSGIKEIPLSDFLEELYLTMKQRYSEFVEKGSEDAIVFAKALTNYVWFGCMTAQDEAAVRNYMAMSDFAADMSDDDPEILLHTARTSKRLGDAQGARMAYKRLLKSEKYVKQSEKSKDLNVLGDILGLSRATGNVKEATQIAELLERRVKAKKAQNNNEHPNVAYYSLLSQYYAWKKDDVKLEETLNEWIQVSGTSRSGLTAMKMLIRLKAKTNLEAAQAEVPKASQLLLDLLYPNLDIPTDKPGFFQKMSTWWSGKDENTNPNNDFNKLRKAFEKQLRKYSEDRGGLVGSSAPVLGSIFNTLFFYQPSDPKQIAKDAEKLLEAYVQQEELALLDAEIKIKRGQQGKGGQILEVRKEITENVLSWLDRLQQSGLKLSHSEIELITTVSQSRSKVQMSIAKLYYDSGHKAHAYFEYQSMLHPDESQNLNQHPILLLAAETAYEAARERREESTDERKIKDKEDGRIKFDADKMKSDAYKHLGDAVKALATGFLHDYSDDNKWGRLEERKKIEIRHNVAAYFDAMKGEAEQLKKFQKRCGEDRVESDNADRACALLDSFTRKINLR